MTSNPPLLVQPQPFLVFVPPASPPPLLPSAPELDGGVGHWPLTHVPLGQVTPVHGSSTQAPPWQTWPFAQPTPAQGSVWHWPFTQT